MARVATDHDEIRQWVEQRGGRPSRVKETGSGNDPGILRIDFPGFSGEDTLEEIDWDQFFDWFERDKLALLLDEGKNSRFNKFVARGNASSSSKRASSSKKKAPAKRAAAKKVVSSKKASSAKKASSSSKKAAPAKKASSSSKKASSKKASAKASSAKKSASKKSAKRGRR
jgi:hypothetical protein